MTVNEAITLARNIKQVDSSQFTDAIMVQFLNEVEGKVQTEILRTPLDELVKYTTSDMSKTLIVEAPHDKLYYPYLCAMIDFVNGEYNKFNNTMIIANSYIKEWANWYLRQNIVEDYE